MRWAEFERAAPQIAARGRERIERFDCVFVGTLRRDGGPRVNPVEAYVLEGRLLTNMMHRSLKALDLLRDPRVYVHTLVTSKSGREGELKLLGRAVVVEDERLLAALSDLFWEKIQWRPPPESHTFEIDLERAAFVRYDEDGTQHVERWAPEREEATS